MTTLINVSLHLFGGRRISPVAVPGLRRQYYWPRDAVRAYSIDAYFAAYATLGYETCDSAEYEEGYDKAALFVDDPDFPDGVLVMA